MVKRTLWWDSKSRDASSVFHARPEYFGSLTDDQGNRQWAIDEICE